MLLLIGISSIDDEQTRIEMSTAKTFLRREDSSIRPVQRDRRWWNFHHQFNWNGWGGSNEWNSWEFD